MPAPEGKKPGRRAFVPTDADRDAVRRMAGAKHRDIARVIGVSVPTLRKAFRDDLAAAKGEDLFSAEAAPRAPSTRPTAGGRRPFQPHDGQRRKVMELAAVGKPPSHIARVLGLSEPTLRKHFAEELEIGAEKIEAELVTALMAKARTGNTPAIQAARAMIAQARLDSIEAAMTAPAPKPETPGKKMQASLDAAGVIETADWAQHLRPN